MKFLEFFLNLSDHISRSLTDGVHRSTKLFHIFTGRPARNIGKGILRCIQSKMVAYHIGNTFCFHFPCKLVFYDALCFHLVTIMQYCMCRFMHRCFHGLCFTHARLDSDIFIDKLIKAFRLPINLNKTDGNRGNRFQCFHKIMVDQNIPLQF